MLICSNNDRKYCCGATPVHLFDGIYGKKWRKFTLPAQQSINQKLFNFTKGDSNNLI